MTAPEQPPISNQRLVFSIAIPCLFGWALSFLATNIYRDYAFGLFVWLPIVLGASSTIMGAYKCNVKRRLLRNLSYTTLGIFCLGLLTFAWEGVICLLMAAPIGILFTYIGHLLGYLIMKGKMRDSAILVMIVLVSSVPALMAFENASGSSDELRLVTTSIEINANAEAVWKNVVEFPQLDEPTEFIFKAGIGYPVNAEIDGTGVGAIRHCNFSTGSFVEPITVWEPGRLLKFNVDSQPEPLKELSFYKNIHPNHLHGYWISKGGQFKLIPSSNGHTRLEGTTWYINKIKPGLYWTLWSDYIVHKIHHRVLNHIKIHSEEAG